MKKIIYLLAINFIGQCTSAQVSYGVHGNLISSRHTFTTSTSTSPLTSYKAGGLTEIKLSRHLTLMPQLNIVVKGGKNMYKSDIDLNRYTERLTYLEIPAYFLYTVKLPMNASFFIGGGPIYSKGLYGKVTGNEQRMGVYARDISYNIEFDSEHNTSGERAHYQPGEFGLGLIGGYQWSNGLLVNAHFYLNNIGSYTNNYYSGCGIGYMLKRGSRK